MGDWEDDKETENEVKLWSRKGMAKKMMVGVLLDSTGLDASRGLPRYSGTYRDSMVTSI